MRIIAIVLMALMVLSMIPVSSVNAAWGEKGASVRAQEVASDEAIHHRVSDWFATVGKDANEKKAILAERKAERTAVRTQKRTEKAAKQTQKQADKGMKGMNKKMKGLGK